MAETKPVHSLVLDAGPIIKNEPGVSTLLQRAEALFTTPAVISEIKDASARARISTTLVPFLTQRTPGPTSVKLIADFARKTGDYAVLSKNDIDVIALTYELECERNHGNWRLRSVPGQKKLNGSPPARVEAHSSPAVELQADLGLSQVNTPDETAGDASSVVSRTATEPKDQLSEHTDKSHNAGIAHSSTTASAAENGEAFQQPAPVLPQSQLASEEPNLDSELHSDADSDSDGWITPSNLKKRQAQDASSTTFNAPEQAVLQTAVLTTDFAMQNVILQMNLNLLSSSLQRVKHLKTFVLRCHACFQITKDMNKQFCPRCGGPTLTRVSCSTNANGEFKLHLKKNMQWNHRGERYSIPKPMHGSANGRNRGGGKNGWGHELILSEDQKEFERANFVDRKHKEKSLMDEDYLPSILTGDRPKGGGRVKVGAGRNVNSRKR